MSKTKEKKTLNSHNSSPVVKKNNPDRQNLDNIKYFVFKINDNRYEKLFLKKGVTLRKNSIPAT